MQVMLKKLLRVSEVSSDKIIQSPKMEQSFSLLLEMNLLKLCFVLKMLGGE